MPLYPCGSASSAGVKPSPRAQPSLTGTQLHCKDWHAEELAIYGTNPNIFDTDGYGLGDGQELGVTNAMITANTNLSVFRADKDPSTTTDPLNADTDGGAL